MNVTHEGWTEKYGAFSYNVVVDETKTDYEIHYASGRILKQDTPFQSFTYDWNNDGDVYEQFGAFFASYNKDGSFERKGVFMTPVDMVSVLVDGMDEYKRQREDVVVSIPGIKLPEPKQRPTVDEQIRRSEQRSMAQDVERNRKMAALGIRHPGEPWAR